MERAAEEGEEGIVRKGTSLHDPSGGFHPAAPRSYTSIWGARPTLRATRHAYRLPMMRIRIENGKPAARRGRKARGLMRETARLPNPEPAAHQRSHAHRHADAGAVFTGAVVILTIALALPGLGTSEARLDPN